MAPISPDSLKRFSPSQSDDDHVEPPAKRRRIDLIEPTLPQTPPNEPEEYVVPPQQDHEKSFNDDPKHLLLRSIALALQHVGFDSAKPEAMEAMCAQVESCGYPSLRLVMVVLTRHRCLQIPISNNRIDAER